MRKSREVFAEYHGDMVLSTFPRHFSRHVREHQVGKSRARSALDVLEIPFLVMANADWEPSALDLVPAPSVLTQSVTINGFVIMYGGTHKTSTFPVVPHLRVEARILLLMRIIISG